MIIDYACIVVDVMTGKEGGVTAEIANPAVSEDLLEEVLTWREEGGCTMDDIICRLRLRTVPNGHEGNLHTWCKGKKNGYFNR